MSEKCLYCQTPIEQKEGKRERKFCKPSCCTMFNLKLKKKDKPKGKRGRPAGAKNKVTQELKDKIADNSKPENKNRIENERNTVIDRSHLNDSLPAGELRDYEITFHNKEAMSQFEKAIAGAVGENKEVIDSSVQDLLTKNVSVTKTELVDGKVKMTNHTYPPFEVKPQSEWSSEMNTIAIPPIQSEYKFGDEKWLVVEKYTKFPDKDRPTAYQARREWDAQKKQSDQLIKDAWNKHKAQ